VDGDEETDSFTRVVLPHLRDALALARWLTGDRADAEDVVQESCLRAFRSMGSYAGGSARAWVLTIVRNTAYSWLDKNRKTNLLAVDDLNRDDRERAERGGDWLEIACATPESELIAKADSAQLAAAIAALPPEFREALALRDIQGLEYREIARVVSVPVGTVMSRLARARRRVMQALRSTDQG